MNANLTFENAHTVAKLAQLIGWSPDRLVNHLLKETLDEAAETKSGWLEAFLSSIYYDDRQSADRALERVTQMTRWQSGGRLPHSFKGEVREYPDGRFGIAAEYIDRRGELNRIC